MLTDWANSRRRMKLESKRLMVQNNSGAGYKITRETAKPTGSRSSNLTTTQSFEAQPTLGYTVTTTTRTGGYEHTTSNIGIAYFTIYRLDETAFWNIQPAIEPFPSRIPHSPHERCDDVMCYAVMCAYVYRGCVCVKVVIMAGL